MAAKIRKNDKVILLTGKDKGKTGQVKQIITKKNKLIVEGLNLVKKHQKPNPQLEQKGGIITKEAAIHVSNVAIYNEKSKKADRVGFRVEDNKKVRFFKSDSSLI